MTKVIKWYQKYNTWNTVLGILTPIAGGELAAAFAGVQLPAWAHSIAGFCALAVIVLRVVVKDVDGNGIIDILQNKVKQPKQNQNEGSS